VTAVPDGKPSRVLEYEQKCFGEAATYIFRPMRQALCTHERRAVLGRNASDGETANPRSSLSTPALIGAQEPTLDRQAVPTQHKKTLISRCPLWVKSGHSAMFEQCPLYPQKRTWISTAVMSAKCPKQT